MAHGAAGSALWHGGVGGVGVRGVGARGLVGGGGDVRRSGRPFPEALTVGGKLTLTKGS